MAHTVWLKREFKSSPIRHIVQSIIVFKEHVLVLHVFHDPFLNFQHIIFRTATCTAKGPVRCLTLDRDAFVKLIGNQAERRYDEHKLSTSSNGSAEPTTPIIHTHCMPCMADLRLSDLKVCQISRPPQNGRLGTAQCDLVSYRRGLWLMSNKFWWKKLYKVYLI